VDLPCEDPEAGADRYAQVAVEAFSGAGQDLILVGHSLGGLTIPLIAERRPVQRMVFLCAMLPEPGRIHDDLQRESPDMGLPPPRGGAYEDPPGTTRWPADAAAAWFFADCDAATAAWACARLRGQCWKITQEVTPLDRWPDTPSTSVIGARDPVINPVWSRRAARSILGVDPVELATGHSPFLSAPDALASVLVSLAEDGAGSA
jgi:pimeloyl-ACP methyl ester carboxylesterase